MKSKYDYNITVGCSVLVEVPDWGTMWADVDEVAVDEEDGTTTLWVLDCDGRDFDVSPDDVMDCRTVADQYAERAVMTDVYDG